MRPWQFLILTGLAAAALPQRAAAGDVAAGAPTDISVTIYRAPGRNGGAIQLNNLGGFAVISETRRITIPAGRHRLRFGGVVDGIIPASAVVSGIPGGILEKNQDADLLSPSALMRAARGKLIMLTRTNPATGKKATVRAEVVAASPQGVVMRTAEGTESLRCSGIAEQFRYDLDASGLNAQPTLSVMTNASRPVTATVQLTYIAEGFDWNAGYTAHLNPDGKTLNLGGWITLANGNSVSLANARTQIVAGGLNRSYVQRFVTNQPVVLAQCWPMETTSDIPERPGRPYELVRPYREPRYDRRNSIIVTGMRMDRMAPQMAAAPTMELATPPPPPPPPPPEQLGDLKLYRVPQRTTVAAMQMKQTRLVDQAAVPYVSYFAASVPGFGYGPGTTQWPAIAMIRMQNDKAKGLGLALPAGQFLIDQDQFGRAMLVGQPDLRDTAEGETVELALGAAPDIVVRRVTVSRSERTEVVEVTVTNAAPQSAAFELELGGDPSQTFSAASHPVTRRDGKRIMAFTVPAQGQTVARFSVTVR